MEPTFISFLKGTRLRTKCFTYITLVSREHLAKYCYNVHANDGQTEVQKDSKLTYGFPAVETGRTIHNFLWHFDFVSVFPTSWLGLEASLFPGKKGSSKTQFPPDPGTPGTREMGSQYILALL